MNISTNLRTLRKAKGMTLEEVGAVFGVKRASVANWESGETRPDLDKLLGLARLFGVTVDQLLSVDMGKRGIPSNRDVNGGDGPSGVGWPFKFSRIRFDRLSEERKNRVELLVLGQIAEWEESSAGEQLKAG